MKRLFRCNRIRRLLLPRVRRRILRAPLLLLHAQLQRVLLLLALQQLLLQRARRGILRRLRGSHQRGRAQNGQEPQDTRTHLASFFCMR